MARPAQPRGPASPHWRGDAIGYARAHQRLGLIAGRPCVECGRPGKGWSLRREAPPDRLRADSKGKDRGRKFSTVPADYEIRCPRCHARYDGQVGERNHLAKLTTAQVLEIRQRYASGEDSQGALGRTFGVHAATIWHIVHGRTWAHVSPALVSA